MEITSSPIWEGVVRYSVSFPEITQALGVAGVIGFAFLAGLKFMPLMPTEARAVA